MSDILSIALSPTIDVYGSTQSVLPYRKTRIENQTVSAGGGGVNVARVIDILGGDVDLIYVAGGKTGIVLADLLAQYGFSAHQLKTEDEVRIACMVHEAVSGIEYRFVPRPNEVAGALADKVCRRVAATRPKFVVASGSLATSSGKCPYIPIAEAAKEAGSKFILDTSGAALKETLETRRVWLVKPSIGELQQLAGRDLDDMQAIEFAGELVREGKSENVVISFGHQGAALINKYGTVRQRGIHVQTASAVGAGDSFVAAMTLAAHSGLNIEEAFRHGVAAGTAAAMTSGTELCRRKDVKGLLASMEPRRFWAVRDSASETPSA